VGATLPSSADWRASLAAAEMCLRDVGE